MPSTSHRRTLRAVLALMPLAVVALAFASVTNAAATATKHTAERLVVRGDATVTDTPCAAGICLQLSDATFRGSPVGSGAYTGAIKLRVADAFPNGEGGLCAPIEGEIVLGAG